MRECSKQEQLQDEAGIEAWQVRPCALALHGYTTFPFTCNFEKSTAYAWSLSLHFYRYHLFLRLLGVYDREYTLLVDDYANTMQGLYVSLSLLRLAIVGHWKTD